MERNWPSVEQRVYMPLFRRTPVTLVRGLGCEVWDDAGRRYLDFVGGWAVNNVGHCHPKVVAAIQEQAATLMQCREFRAYCLGSFINGFIKCRKAHAFPVIDNELTLGVFTCCLTDFRSKWQARNCQGQN